MHKKMLNILLLVGLLFSVSVASAQTTYDFRRNDDAATVTTQPNSGPLQAGTNRNREVYVIAKPGLEVCSAASTGTSATTIIPAVALTSHYVSRIRCSNNSAVASLFSTAGLVQTGLYIGTTTLGDNTKEVNYPNPVKVAVNTAVTFTMATTATSTICCANYKDYPNP